MPATRYVASAHTATAKRAVRSSEASSLLHDLLALDYAVRAVLMTGLTERDLDYLLLAARIEMGTPYALWQGNPVGFATEVLGENLWSAQRRFLAALPRVKRVAVPAGFGLGKTAGGALAVLYEGSVWPVGTALAITIATRMRQVIRQLWPHVRRMHARAGLPGRCDMVQWRAPNHDGVETDVAYGFTSPEHDEAGMQGIHVPGRLLLVVDEAGGIGRAIGSSTRNLLTGDAVMLAIGNPPTDDEGGWFEGLCEDGADPEVSDTVTVRIPATDSPAITGEAAGTVEALCRTCPPGALAHEFARHLVDQDWIDAAIREHGPDAPYVVSKVHARFPRGGSFRIIPSEWVDAAADVPEPAADGALWLRLRDLGLPDETGQWVVRRGAWVRLGVDVAADGGDELVVSRTVGNLATVEHVSSGPDNAHAVTVAGKVLEHIRRAENVRTALGTEAPVRVKIDGIGVGWGVASILSAWGSEGLHGAEIVVVIVSEGTGREPDAVTLRPALKRDEMWLAGRALLQPGPTLVGALRLRVDERTLAQLRSPKYTTNSRGLTVVESKKSMRKRGLSSPDRAEAVLLGIYEPFIEETGTIRLFS